jgi:hypothetical protein
MDELQMAKQRFRIAFPGEKVSPENTSVIQQQELKGFEMKLKVDNMTSNVSLQHCRSQVNYLAQLRK